MAAGHHRIEAARTLGWIDIETIIADYTDVELWSVGDYENASQRGELMGAALDSVAGLIRVAARLHYEGRDAELEELVGSATTAVVAERDGRGRSTVAQITDFIDSGRGIGEATVYKIVKNRRLKMSVSIGAQL